MRNEEHVSGAKLLTIGQVAKLSGVGAETIRFYERKGVLLGTQRKASGFRLFDPDTVYRLEFIRRVQSAGFSLKEVRELTSSKGIAAAIVQIDRRIQELEDLKRELRPLPTGD